MAEITALLLAAKILLLVSAPVARFVKAKFYPNNDIVVERIKHIGELLNEIPKEARTSEVEARIGQIRNWLASYNEEQKNWQADSGRQKFSFTRRKQQLQAKSMSKKMEILAKSTSAQACASYAAECKLRHAGSTNTTLADDPRVKHELPKAEDLADIAEYHNVPLKDVVGLLGEAARILNERGLGATSRTCPDSHSSLVSPTPAALSVSSPPSQVTATERLPEEADSIPSTASTNVTFSTVDIDQDSDSSDDTTGSDTSSILQLASDEVSECVSIAESLMGLPNLNFSSLTLTAVVFETR